MTERRLQITVEAIDKATEELKDIRTQLEGLDKAGKKSSDGFKESGKGADSLTGKLIPMLATITGVTGGMMALRKAMDFSWDAALLTARVDTLGVVTEQLGSNVGFTRYEIRQEEEAIQALGITTQASRQSIARMIESNIDLSASTKLAREAQDAAVIAGINSSEAFERLVNTIASGNVEMARTMGLNVNFQRSYNALAESLGKSVTELTELEKVQARTNEVLKAGANITGTYEAAMETVGKQLSSLPRYYEEFKVAFGENFQEPLGEGVALLTNFLKATTDAMEGRNALREATEKGFISEEEYNKTLQYGYVSTELLARAEAALEQEQIQLNAASKLGAGQMWDYAQMAGKAGDEVSAAVRNFRYSAEEVQGFIGSKLGTALDDYHYKMETLKLDQYEMRVELKELLDKGWSPNSEKVRELNQRLSEGRIQQQELKATLAETTKELTYQELAGRLDAEAAFNLASKMGLVDWQARITHDAVETLTDKYDLNRDGAVDAGEATHDYMLEAAGLWDVIQGMTDKTITITTIFREIHSGYSDKTYGGNWGGGGQEGVGVNKSEPINPGGGVVNPNPIDSGDDEKYNWRATGGPVAAGSTYLMGERVITRPEVYVPLQDGYVLTKQDAQRALSGSARSGGIIINNSFNISATDPRETARQIMKIIVPQIGGMPS